MEKIKIGIIGATGSVGKNALYIIKRFKDLFEVNFLVAESNYKLLTQFAKETNAKNLVIIDQNKFHLLKEECEKLKLTNTILQSGNNSLLELIKEPNQVILVANNGIAALEYILQCISSNQTIVLANKEALVSAGSIINNNLSKSNAKIIPADSEHNAIFQILTNNYKKEDLEEIVITASGGPFYNYNDDELDKVTKQEAIKHPNWSMGEVISVNSATLVNKALEFIEAYYLFKVDINKIKTVYHPQSLIHGMVKYKDGALNLLAYKPTMQIALSYALFPNARLPLPDLQISCLELNKIIIEEIKPNKNKPIILAKQALLQKGNGACIFNVANEEAVNAFLLGKVKFLSIISIIEYCLNKIPYKELNNIDDVYNQSIYVREVATNYINRLE